MKIGVLHISDIHLKVRNNPVLEKVKKIHSGIKSETYGLSHLFLVISGDIAYSGKLEEYNNGMMLIDTVKQNVADELKLDVSVIIIPGNHDCNFEIGNSAVRDLLVRQIHDDSTIKLDDSIVNQLCGTQDDYFDFIGYYDEDENCVCSEKLFKKYIFELDGYSIGFNCLNTSWISELHEQPGKMYFPIEKFKEYLNSRENLSLTVLHHPYNWFNPENRRYIQNVLEESSDIILTGHEHVSKFGKFHDFKKGSVNMIEGGALQEIYKGQSEFNLIIFDLYNNSQKLINYNWGKDKYYPEQPICLQGLKNDAKVKKEFEPNENFETYLNDIGFTLNHPNQSNISIDDIYVYPDAKVAKVKGKADEFEEYVNLEKLLSQERIGKTVLTGGEKSGKTAFCKQFYKYSLQTGYIPVFVEGKTINKHKIEDFNKIVYKAFNSQYHKELLEEFKQLEDRKKLIILENFNNVKLNEQFSGQLLANIHDIYPNVLITSDEFFNLSNLVESDVGSVLDDYQKYEIQELGHKLRARLINRWNSLGVSETLEKKDLISENDDSENTVNTIIGNNYVPSYPFFILVILQSIETGRSHKFQESTYGHYYEHLINQPFFNIKMKNDEIEMLYNYITEFAYVYFSDESLEKSAIEHKDFHNWYCDEYDLNLNSSETIEKLKELKILHEFDNGYQFKYSYVYYYFVALYLARNIDDQEVRYQISEMSKKLFVKENANIIMFLTHHSKSPFIFDQILTNAQSIFDEFEPANLGEGIATLNNLINEIPKMVYKNTDVSRNRDKRNELKDQIERAEQETNNGENEVSSSLTEGNDSYALKQEDLDMSGRLNLAFKTLEILGQILKNYYGSIKGTQKFVLSEEAYFLGLRALNTFLIFMDRNVENIVEEVQAIIKEKELEDRKDIENLSKRLIFGLCCGVSFQFIKKISSAVGTKNLEGPLNKILKKHDTIAVELIDISIKLDHVKKLPYNDIKSLKEVTKESKNVMSYSLLRQLVIDHLYMFEVGYQDKQKICNTLDISMEKQRSIGLLSNRKKV
ncbi:MAG TPA: metallophosphoesterase [Bacillales bacterium]|nr:metallophosphoesterase [Bacillales bacterium]